MKAMFVGPLGKVTGSCTWLFDERKGWNLLVDCGMQQGERTEQEWNAGHWPFDPAKLKLVVLTHAHLDHCGLIPLLYKRGFKGSVYCSKETAQLATIQLKDAIKISDLGYTAADVDKIKWHEPGKGGFFGRFHPVDDDLFLRFFRAGHVIGAVSVAVYWGPKDDQRSINFSGDVGPDTEDAENLPWLRHRMGVGSCDFAVLESTYGDKVRDAEAMSAMQRRARLKSLLDQTVDQNGALVLPAFSLGRTQDVLFDLHQIVAESNGRFDEVKFFMDSPSARKMHVPMVEGFMRTENNGVSHGKVRPCWLGKQFFRAFGLNDKDPDHCSYAEELCRSTLLAEPLSWSAGTHKPGNALSQAWRSVFTLVRDRDQTAKQIVGKPIVLLIGSGMCDGGPAAYWLPRLLGLRSTTVATTGYASSSSVAGRLMSVATLSSGERSRLSGELIWEAPGSKYDDAHYPMKQIEARITALSGYSAHADQKGLVDWAFSEHKGDLYAAGKTIFIQHGEDRARKALAAALKERAMQHGIALLPVVMPEEFDDVYDLDCHGQLMTNERRADELQAQIELLNAQLRKMQKAA